LQLFNFGRRTQRFTLDAKDPFPSIDTPHPIDFEVQDPPTKALADVRHSGRDPVDYCPSRMEAGS
jgi:hypothetical protein